MPKRNVPFGRIDREVERGMKKRRRLAAILLTLALLAGMMPVSVMAEEPGEEVLNEDSTVGTIDSLTVNVTAPKAGQKSLETKPQVSITGDHASLQYSGWLHGLNVYASTEPDFTFEAGETYYIHLTIKADNGWYFQKGSTEYIGNDEGYRIFDGCTVNGGTKEFAASRTFDGIDYLRVKLSVTPEANTHTVTFNTDGLYRIPADQKVADGAKASRPAFPAMDANSNSVSETGLHFQNWFTKPASELTSYTDLCFTPDNGGCIFDFANTPITKDTTVYAASWSVLTLKTYDLTRSAESSGGVLTHYSIYYREPQKTTGIQTTTIKDTQETLTAEPFDGYLFRGWSTSRSINDIVSTDKTYTYTNNGRRTLYALFEEAPVMNVAFGTTDGGTYRVGTPYHSEDEIMSYSINMSLYEGNEVTLKAEAEAGYRFKGWYEGVIATEGDYRGFVDGNNGKLISSDNPYSFTVTSLTLLQAVFEKGEDPIPEKTVQRIAGADRVATSLQIASKLKEVLGVNQFDTAVLSTGRNFPDALAGGYFANLRSAPIIMIQKDKDDRSIKAVTDFIKKNVRAGSTLYVLGGEPAVSSDWLTGITAAGFKIERLAGSDRYETNLKILERVGLSSTGDVLVATGRNYPDALSASAVRLPILLVDSKTQKLTEQQLAFLKPYNKLKFHIVGAEAAVPKVFETLLKPYGTVDRIAGAGRWETSVAIAERFFDSPQRVTIAYSQNFPDGLCGGVLANRLNAPLLLVTSVPARYQPAMAYASKAKLTRGAVFGGAQLVDDSAASKIAGGAVVKAYVS